jgi:hypothetical protein
MQSRMYHLDTHHAIGGLRVVRRSCVCQSGSMGVSDHWVRVLLNRRSEHGDAVFAHGLRGLPSNRRLAAKTQRQAPAILK